jgi:transposase
LKWKELAKRLQTVPGIGPTLASILISELSELGNISNKEIASAATLRMAAPFC